MLSDAVSGPYAGLLTCPDAHEQGAQAQARPVRDEEAAGSSGHPDQSFLS